MRLMSEANTHQHWRKKYERTKRQTNAVKLVWGSQRPSVAIPCRVRLVRTGRRELDFSNLVYAFKGIQDAVADLIIPGLAPGQADGPNRGIEWSYGQEIGLYGIRIEIEYDEPSYRDGKALC
jgi:hypothetical protein